MYHDLKSLYWWSGMKRDVVDYVSRCLTCQQVKAEHQRPAGLLQPLRIPEWKWEDIAMDFVVGLPKTVGQHDSVWVIVDRYTKSAHFLPVKVTFTVDQYAELYVKEIVRLHGAPKTIVSDRDPKFTSKFWEGLQRAMGTRLKFSTAFHPQTDGQTERTIQILERVGQVAYRLALPPALAGVHNVFHVSMLRKYILDESHILSYGDLVLDSDLSYEEQPVQVLDRKDKVLRNKTIPLVKVLWRNSKVEEAT